MLVTLKSYTAYLRTKFCLLSQHLILCSDSSEVEMNIHWILVKKLAKLFNCVHLVSNQSSSSISFLLIATAMAFCLSGRPDVNTQFCSLFQQPALAQKDFFNPTEMGFAPKQRFQCCRKGTASCALTIVIYNPMEGQGS